MDSAEVKNNEAEIAFRISRDLFLIESMNSELLVRELKNRFDDDDSTTICERQRLFYEMNAKLKTHLSSGGGGNEEVLQTAAVLDVIILKLLRISKKFKSVDPFVSNICQALAENELQNKKCLLQLKNFIPV